MERITRHRANAAHHLTIARSDMARVYAIVRRYSGDRRWGRVDQNPEARPVLAELRRRLRHARTELRAAEALEDLLTQLREAA
ncbi:hypothetical protein LPC08_00360 [Roseomonas sp. OT10]|uniref:hypothetical protein n=1 Tax=Roseomonas cutis TaxID=2897332 RepID=UPI001E620BB9|nr:hypothetical protein [Roseomonas sp. OT10]UFN49138.1 hypothetical protein LPC08_00360 [Roseomonas sp. OT10]